MWSIGIYRGKSLFELTAPPEGNNPVLTCESVSDVSAGFVADPFMVRAGGVWYMFFEAFSLETDKGEIGLAISDNGLDWKYQQIVLSEPFHLSYPYVFEWDGEHYMIPETLEAEAIHLYKAIDFPTRWSDIGALVKSTCADPSIFRFRDRWWMVACSTPYQHDTLRLYFAEDLMGQWAEHPASPIVEGNKRSARPGGRVLVWSDRIIRFAQDCIPAYGAQLRAFEISELTDTTYAEREHPNSPILTASGAGWNGRGMHHIDPYQLLDGQWIACVDGLDVDSLSESEASVRVEYAVNGEK
jgi:hypothetical protein